MAVVGARHATGVGLLGRRSRVRSRPWSGSSGPVRRGAELFSRQRSGAPSLLVGIAAAAGVALFYLSQSTQVAAGGYQLEQLRARIVELHAAQQALMLQIGEASSPARIEQQARDELDLVLVDQLRITFATPADRSR